MNPSEPTERKVEALAKDVQQVCVGASANWAMTDPMRAEEHRRVARLILAREARLVEALERIYASADTGPINRAVAADALAAHRAATQPSEPTLAEAVEAMLETPLRVAETGFNARFTGFPTRDVEAVRAALARERGGK